MDLILRNARILDGSGQPAVHGDIGVSDGRIVALGPVSGPAKVERDLQCKVLAPGFIDVHTHYDAQSFWDPMLTPSSHHGVTTVIAGNCGFTLAPLSGREDDFDYLLRMLSRVEGMPLSSLRNALQPQWSSFGEFLEVLEGKLAINAGFLVGHSALRRAIMGDDAIRRVASNAEIDAMCALLDTSLAQGGLGLSTTTAAAHIDYEGVPVPSRWAERKEMLALCSVVGRHPGTWLEMVPGTLEFTAESADLIISMAIAAGRTLNWNVYQVSSQDPHSFASQLALTDRARERGADVFGLMQAAPSRLLINLRTGHLFDGLPGWGEMLRLPHAEKLRALSDPRMRERLACAPDGGKGGGLSGLFRDWGLMTIEQPALEKNAVWRGRTVADLASALGQPAFDAMVDLAIAEDLQTSFAPPQAGADDEAWTMRAAAWRDTDRCLVGGSDAGAHLDMGDGFTLPTRLLGEGVRKRGLLSFEQAVRMLTALPAERFGLVDRGSIKVGNWADLVVFDPDTVGPGEMTVRHDLPGGEMRLYAEPTGIECVIANGRTVIERGQATGELGGSILRSGRDTRTVEPRRTPPAKLAEGLPAMERFEAMS